jgi:hypothetical protein
LPHQVKRSSAFHFPLILRSEFTYTLKS